MSPTRPSIRTPPSFLCEGPSIRGKVLKFLEKGALQYVSLHLSGRFARAGERFLGPLEIAFEIDALRASGEADFLPLRGK